MGIVIALAVMLLWLSLYIIATLIKLHDVLFTKVHITNLMIKDNIILERCKLQN